MWETMFKVESGHVFVVLGAHVRVVDFNRLLPLQCMSFAGTSMIVYVLQNARWLAYCGLHVLA